jgi:hypothetical protein
MYIGHAKASEKIQISGFWYASICMYHLATLLLMPDRSRVGLPEELSLPGRHQPPAHVAHRQWRGGPLDAKAGRHKRRWGGSYIV